MQARKSASLLKQLANTTVKQPEAESNDLDGVAPLQTEPVPCDLNNEEPKRADVPVLHCSDTVVEASSLPITETRHSSNDVEEVARNEILLPSYPTTKIQEKASNRAWAALKYLCPIPDFSKWDITRLRICLCR